jgi:NAD(P)-dependent dehydrogenase (short-subunit alcohol dehydrogenase family)
MYTVPSRVVVITGAGSGIGRACAEELAGRGHRVHGGDIRTEVAPFSNPVTFTRLDVDDDISCREFVRRVVEHEGRIDVVLNNAGFGIAGPAEETSSAEAHAQLETLFFGVARMCREVLPVMREQTGGLIVNMSSIGGLIALPFQSFYSAGKFAVEGYSEALRQEVEPFGIRVVLIEPADVRTGFTDSRRIVAAHTGTSPYRDRVGAVLATAERDERTGSDPAEVARLVAHIVAGRRNRFRYTVGHPLVRATPLLRRAVPAPMAEWLMRAYWNRT